MSSVDVIVPCYRYGHFLRECVQSVLSQEGVEVRVLVIDDASPDNTPEVGRLLASEDRRVTYLRHLVNKGHIATYNEGIEWVASDYYLLLSADDYLLPGALRRASKVMDANSDVVLCYGNALELLSNMSVRQIDTGFAFVDGAEARVMKGREFMELCRVGGSYNIVPTPTALVRTNLQRQLAGYRPELPHSADFELWLRLSAHGSVGFIPTNQAVYRRHATNMSLSYQGEHHLLDLRQRHAAIEWACKCCADVIVDVVAMQHALLRPLGTEAIGCAGAALNDNNEELAKQFVEFAHLVYPNVNRTKVWSRYALKRLLGYRVTSALMPTVAFLRRAAARVFN